MDQGHWQILLRLQAHTAAGSIDPVRPSGGHSNYSACEDGTVDRLVTKLPAWFGS